MTDGGADFSFECVGDTEVVSTALKSCSDVIPSYSFTCSCLYEMHSCETQFVSSLGLGSDGDLGCPEDKP